MVRWHIPGFAPGAQRFLGRPGTGPEAPAEGVPDSAPAAEERWSRHRETALFPGPFGRRRRLVVLNAAHQQGAHFYLGDGAEMFGVEDGIFPAVLCEHGAAGQGNGPYGVQDAGQEVVFPLGAPIHITITVIIPHTQAENQTETAAVLPGNFASAQQLRQGIPATFDSKDPVRFNGKYGQKPVAGGD